MIPFLGTTLGAACVFFVKNSIKPSVHKILLGFASGVMVAASVWSLLIPAMEMSDHLGRFAFIPAVTGLAVGMVFLLLMDKMIPHLHYGSQDPEGPKSGLARTTMLVLAVTLHNIPEGMAVGVVSAAGAFALAVGIAIQNFPEGAIISLPLRGGGMGRKRAFLMGTLSGIVEPIGAVITIVLARIMSPILPYTLAFAAGAMLYVVVEELIPESSEGDHSDKGTLGFALGFMIMMTLDVALG